MRGECKLIKTNARQRKWRSSIAHGSRVGIGGADGLALESVVLMVSRWEWRNYPRCVCVCVNHSVGVCECWLFLSLERECIMTDIKWAPNENDGIPFGHVTTNATTYTSMVLRDEWRSVGSLTWRWTNNRIVTTYRSSWTPLTHSLSLSPRQRVRTTHSLNYVRHFRWVGIKPPNKLHSMEERRAKWAKWVVSGWLIRFPRTVFQCVCVCRVLWS